MKVFSPLCNVLFAAFCFILAFPRADCSEQIYDGVHGSHEELNSYQNSPLYRRLITSEDEAARTTSTDAFDELQLLRLLRKKLNEIAVITSDKVLKEKFLSNLYSNSEATSVKENDEAGTSLGHRKLNRRSVLTLETEDDQAPRSTRAPDSGLSEPTPNSNDKLSPDTRVESPASFSLENRDENQHSEFQSNKQLDAPSPNHGERNSFRPSFEISLKGQMGGPDRYRTPEESQHFGNILGLLRNGPSENFRLGLPGQPIRRILGFLLDRLPRPWPIVDVDQSRVKLPGRLLDQGRNTLNSVRENSEFGRAGIHRVVRLGPLSVSVDVERP